MNGAPFSLFRIAGLPCEVALQITKLAFLLINKDLIHLAMLFLHVQKSCEFCFSFCLPSHSSIANSSVIFKKNRKQSFQIRINDIIFLQYYTKDNM